MSTKVNVKWLDGMGFEADVNNHKIVMDADETLGGTDRGPRPKALVLAALGGCTGMDVVSMLKKMKVDLVSFEMEIDGEVSEEHPKVYTGIHIKYVFRGKGLDPEKCEKASNLSFEKYCSVSAMLKKAANVTYSVVIEEI
jgi:putative redox protein